MYDSGAGTYTLTYVKSDVSYTVDAATFTSIYVMDTAVYETAGWSYNSSVSTASDSYITVASELNLYYDIVGVMTITKTWMNGSTAMTADQIPESLDVTVRQTGGGGTADYETITLTKTDAVTGSDYVWSTTFEVPLFYSADNRTTFRAYDYTISEAVLDGYKETNSGSMTASLPIDEANNQGTYTASLTNTRTYGASGGLTIEKTITNTSGSGTVTKADTFSFTVTGPMVLSELVPTVSYKINDGTAQSVTVTDDDTNGDSFTVSGVKHGDAVTILTPLPTGTYSVTETADNSGSVNTYTVSSDTADSTLTEGGYLNITVTNTPETTNVTVTSIVDGAETETAAVGTEITYTITYYNNNNTKATVTVTDTLPDGLEFVSSNPAYTTADDPTWTWTIENVPAFTYGTVTVVARVTEAAVRNVTGTPSLTNTATVQIGAAEAETVTDTVYVHNPSWTVEKTVSGMNGEVDSTTGLKNAQVGDTLTYTITIANTGNVAITETVTDTFTVDGGEVDLELSAVSCTASDGSSGSGTYDADAKTVTLAEGETIVLTAEYTVTTTDNRLVNTVIVGDPDDPDSPCDTVTTAVENMPVLILIKKTTSTPEDGMTYALGETITYMITLTNLGNVTIYDITVEDELTGKSGADAWTVGSLAPGETMEFTTSYTVTEADILAGSVVNQATVVGSAPSGTVSDGTLGDADAEMVLVTPEDSEEAKTEDATQDPNVTMTLVKETTSTPADGVNYVLGETITYRITVTNVGNLTITNVEEEDELTGNTGENVLTADSLAPGESVVFDVSYIVTEEDVLAGSVINEASANAVAPYEYMETNEIPLTPDNPEDGIMEVLTGGAESEDDSSAPQTGDGTPILPYMMLMLGAFGVLLAGETRRRRRRGTRS